MAINVLPPGRHMLWRSKQFNQKKYVLSALVDLALPTVVSGRSPRHLCLFGFDKKLRRCCAYYVCTSVCLFTSSPVVISSGLLRGNKH